MRWSSKGEKDAMRLEQLHLFVPHFSYLCETMSHSFHLQSICWLPRVVHQRMHPPKRALDGLMHLAITHVFESSALNITSRSV